MTILTKPSNDKKAEKIPLPLALDDVAVFNGVAQRTLLSRQQSDADAESMIFNRAPHFSCLKTILLFFLSLMVMGMGVLGGFTLYRMYSPPQSMHYRALCDIPYMGANNRTLPRFYARPGDFDFLLPTSNEDIMGLRAADLVEDSDSFFREDIELDMTDDEGYAKINVPDFKDGRKGKFMHDFKENQSAIIDSELRRCFILPLDRDTTLPPRSFVDLLEKMSQGYYNIDTERVRRTMRVTTPAIDNLSLVSERIADECKDKRAYMLEDYVSGISKREVKQPITDAGKFAEFLGRGIVEYDFINIADVEAYERAQDK